MPCPPVNISIHKKIRGFAALLFVLVIPRTAINAEVKKAKWRMKIKEMLARAFRMHATYSLHAYASCDFIGRPVRARAIVS